jgi:hypothetical protein
MNENKRMVRKIGNIQENKQQKRSQGNDERTEADQQK